MRRITTPTLVLALALFGCAAGSGRVPLATDETMTGSGGCILIAVVADVRADPTSGTPIFDGVIGSVKWPAGYAARRAGSEVEVLDAAGRVVLRTGSRYWMCPSAMKDASGRDCYCSDANGWWVIGEVKPCPDGTDWAAGRACEPGYQQL